MAIYGTLATDNILSIDASIADNAVDIFVYDTRKDSDGGAWRKRTQHTSWYNETLNTATRGARREFPAVAVIVAETDTLTIYDGDDPDLPMWMKFERDNFGANKFLTGNRNNTGVTAINGIIAWCDTTDAQILKFIADTMLLYGGSGLYSPNTSIVNRNNTSAVNFTIIDSSVLILTGSCNDIAMTVLPNAPIDPSTGLPVPTIAVATDGGVSVIKDDGSVVDITWISYRIASSVYFKDNYLWLTNDGGIFNKGGRYLKKYSIPSSDISESHGYLRNSALKYWASPWGFLGAYTGTSYPPLLGSYGGFYGPAVGPYWGGSNETSGGLTIIGDEGTTTTNGLVAYATTSYNTGWMHGDIKGAFLADTDGTSVTGTELVTNGTFDTDVSDWVVDGNTTITYNSGEALVSASSTAHYASQQINVSPNTTYTYSWKARRGTISTLKMSVYDNSNNSNIIAPYNYGATTSMQSYSLTFTTPSGCSNINIYLLRDSGATGTAYFDDASLRIAEEDRSVNAKGLGIYGTITKSPVATGAELVGYSGWSANGNYLYRPYSTDIQIGTNDACHMGWFNTSDSSTSERMVVSFEGSGTYGTAFNVRLETDHKLAGWATNNSFSSNINVKTSQTLNDGVWHHFAWVKRSGTYSLYVDGLFIGSATYSNDLSYTNNNEAITIGVRNISKLNHFSNGKIALVRFSHSAPSPDQIRKIYEDEKVLFQEGAQCTLYGSSDAVTALAYDDTTNLLHVGTASGRSEFKGLRRVGNTTTAVTTAISASNGLIAEQ